MRRFAAAAFVVAMLGTACSGVPVPARTHARAVPTRVAVFLRDDATEAQRNAIGAKLRAARGVRSVQFVSRMEAYRRLKKEFKDRPRPVQTIRPQDLLESYQVRFAQRDDAATAVGAVRRMPGVRSAQVLPTPTASPTP